LQEKSNTSLIFNELFGSLDYKRNFLLKEAMFVFKLVLSPHKMYRLRDPAVVGSFQFSRARWRWRYRLLRFLSLWASYDWYPAAPKWVVIVRPSLLNIAISFFSFRGLFTMRTSFNGILYQYKELKISSTKCLTE
jgi:hypothetical protein